MLSVITWKWMAKRSRSVYTAAHVNRLRAMVAQYYPHPHRFLCATDDAEGIDADIQIISDWNDFAHVPSPHGGDNPSCYRRLKLFDPAAEDVLGKRFVSLDLDLVFTGDLSPLWNRSEDCVFYGDTNPKTHYNGSMMLLTAGARPRVWTDFDPEKSPKKALAANVHGSDQGWISYALGPHEAKWTMADGVYSFRNHFRMGRLRELPENAKVIVFHGREKPWDIQLPGRYPWVAQHYRAMQREAVA